MPTYEYECVNCKKIFELFQRMTEPAIKTCPKCGQPVFRLIGAGGGIIFKGSGFYATDYKKKNRDSIKADAETSAPQREADFRHNKVDDKHRTSESSNL